MLRPSLEVLRMDKKLYMVHVSNSYKIVMHQSMSYLDFVYKSCKGSKLSLTFDLESSRM